MKLLFMFSSTSSLKHPEPLFCVLVKDGHISPWIDFFEKYYATKTRKQRQENGNLWTESRTGGKELHIFVGEKGKDRGKVHLIIDDVSGEIRIDRKDQIPVNLLKRVGASLTTRDGKKIRATMDFFENEEIGGT